MPHLSLSIRRVVALGGGHGLSASLRALRRVTSELTAVVGVSDNGGSSGRLREEFNILPPGDLRMALAALCDDDTWGETWARVLQHRFSSKGDLDGHSLGNLLITALWQETGDIVDGLNWVAQLLDAQGKVLPLCIEPLDVVGHVQTPSGSAEIVGQVEVATTPYPITSVELRPKNPQVCRQAVDAVRNAESVVLGPGSWFTSVLTHFEVAEMKQALIETSAQRVLVLNIAPQTGETDGYAAHSYLEVLQKSAPEFRLDQVIADIGTVSDRTALEQAAGLLGASVTYEHLRDEESNKPVHDARKLASAFDYVFTHGKINTWQ